MGKKGFDKANAELERLRKKFLVPVLFFADEDKGVLSVMNSRLLSPFPEEVRNAMFSLQTALQNWCNGSDFISLGKSEFRQSSKQDFSDVTPDDSNEV